MKNDNEVELHLYNQILKNDYSKRVEVKTLFAAANHRFNCNISLTLAL